VTFQIQILEKKLFWKLAVPSKSLMRFGNEAFSPKMFSAHSTVSQRFFRPHQIKTLENADML